MSNARGVHPLCDDCGRPAGDALEADKSYRVAGWASVNPQEGKPVSEIVAGYLRAEKTVRRERVNRVGLKGVDDNPGFDEGG